MATAIVYATWYSHGNSYVLVGDEADNTAHTLALVLPDLWQAMAADGSVDDSGSASTYGEAMDAAKASIATAGIWDVAEYGPPH